MNVKWINCEVVLLHCNAIYMYLNETWNTWLYDTVIKYCTIACSEMLSCIISSFVFYDFVCTTLSICTLDVLSFFNFFIEKRCLIISPLQKYFDFALNLIINFLDHLQVWCRLSWAWPLAELEVVKEVYH